MKTYSFKQIQNQISATTGATLAPAYSQLEKAVFYLSFDDFLEVKGESDEDDVKEFFALNPYVLNPDRVPSFSSGKFYIFRLFKKGDVLYRSELIAESDSFPNPHDEVLVKEEQACVKDPEQFPFIQVVAISGSDSDEYHGISCSCVLNVQLRELCTGMVLLPLEEVKELH